MQISLCWFTNPAEAITADAFGLLTLNSYCQFCTWTIFHITGLSLVEAVQLIMYSATEHVQLMMLCDCCTLLYICIVKLINCTLGWGPYGGKTYEQRLGSYEGRRRTDKQNDWVPMMENGEQTDWVPMQTGSRPAWEEMLFPQGTQCSCTVCLHNTAKLVPSSLFVQCCTCTLYNLSGILAWLKQRQIQMYLFWIRQNVVFNFHLAYSF